MGIISTDINKKANDAKDEMKALSKERNEIIDGMWAALVARQHTLLIGPGGTGKSLLCRSLIDHFEDVSYFETALDETTDPSQVFGPPDIKAMVEDGKTRRIPDGMLPTAHYAYFDEYFNANTPMLHSMRPILNERLFHNNGQPVKVPFRAGVMGTNVVNADTDHAPDFDRLHLRYNIRYVEDRDALSDLMMEAMARRITGFEAPEVTTLSLDELDTAYNEALTLTVPSAVEETFFDIKDELRHTHKVEVSTRRIVEGMAAVLANAWMRGHEEVKTADLDILSAMWFTQLDQMESARSVILSATNPGEKETMDKLRDFDDLKQELVNIQGLDEVKQNAAGLQIFKNAKKLRAEGETLLDKAQAAGTSTTRMTELVEKCEGLMSSIQRDIFGIDS